MNNLVKLHELRVVPVNENQETTLFGCLWSAQKSLAEAKTIEDTQKIRQNVKAWEDLSRDFKLSKEVQVDATELRIRAERRLGEMLKRTEKNKGTQSQLVGRGIIGGNSELPPINSSLSDLGITKNDSSKFQQLASVDESTFNSILADLKEQALAGSLSALSTTGVLRAIRDKKRGDREPSFSPLTKPSDNWNFGSLKYGRIDESMDDDWGYIPGEIYANCFWYYVKPGDLVVAPMAGSGQSMRVYEDRKEWMGSHVYDFDLRMFDLSPRGRYKDLIGQHNLVESFPVENPDYIVMDIPYYGMVANHYSDKPEDLANMAWSEWIASMEAMAKNCASSQQPGALCTVMSPNYRDVAKGTMIMVANTLRLLWSDAGYTLYDEACSSRRIQQSQSPNMARMNNLAKANRIMLTDITYILTFKKTDTHNAST